MNTITRVFFISFLFPSLLGGCARMHLDEDENIGASSSRTVVTYPVESQPARFSKDYSALLPESYDTRGRKMILINPSVHAWGAYDDSGRLLRAGIATAGGIKCPSDTNNSTCRTGVGTFRIRSLGDGSCVSSIYPKPNGGGLMPYCMFFHGGQALHGSPDPVVVEANVSHGCVRLRIADAEWIRYNFAEIGTKVVVMPY